MGLALGNKRVRLFVVIFSGFVLVILLFFVLRWLESNERLAEIELATQIAEPTQTAMQLTQVAGVSTQQSVQRQIAQATQTAQLAEATAMPTSIPENQETGGGNIALTAIAARVESTPTMVVTSTPNSQGTFTLTPSLTPTLPFTDEYDFVVRDSGGMVIGFVDVNVSVQPARVDSGDSTEIMVEMQYTPADGRLSPEVFTGGERRFTLIRESEIIGAELSGGDLDRVSIVSASPSNGILLMNPNGGVWQWFVRPGDKAVGENELEVVISILNSEFLEGGMGIVTSRIYDVEITIEVNPPPFDLFKALADLFDGIFGRAEGIVAFGSIIVGLITAYRWMGKRFGRTQPKEVSDAPR